MVIIIRIIVKFVMFCADLSMSVLSWSEEEVADWLTASNLQPLCERFQSKWLLFRTMSS